MNRLDHSHAGRHAGFTLVEVLVSIVVLSFGLLGMVGLQAASLQANRDARLQSVASLLARELAEMMRGNKDIANLATANPYMGDFSSPLIATTPTYCLAIGSVCSSATSAAQAQLTEWLARADAELPGARVVICSDSAPFDGNGMPQWACTAPAASSATLVVVKIGWTRSSTKKATTASETGLERATLPSIVLPVTAGSTL
jgi:type IV pilus assembly protein PilV